MYKCNSNISEMMAEGSDQASDLIHSWSYI